MSEIENGLKVRKVAKIRDRYNQVPHLTQDATWKSDKNTTKQHKQCTTIHILLYLKVPTLAVSNSVSMMT